MWFARPVVCVPTFPEQWEVAFRLETTRTGFTLDPAVLTSAAVAAALDAALGRPSVHGEVPARTARAADTVPARVADMSLVLRGGGGAKAAARTVELAARVGTGHLRSAAERRSWEDPVPWVSLWGVDAMAVHAVVLLALGVAGGHCCLGMSWVWGDVTFDADHRPRLA